MDAVLGSQNREVAPQRRPDAEDVRAIGVNMHHARAFVAQDMLQPSDIGGPKRAPQILERIFADGTSVTDHHPGGADHFAQLRVGGHQRDAMIGAALLRSQCEIDEETFRPADIARDDDVNDLWAFCNSFAHRPCQPPIAAKPYWLEYAGSRHMARAV